MITYVINTSESRTLNNNQLFDLAGYNKIKWLNCPLSEVKQCAQHIYDKQNILGADKFRIAVLVDFFGFDRIRVPFGRVNYHYDDGVDISLYLPYIEVYLLDNLIKYLENRELHATDFEIYYVQNTKLEHYDFINNAKDQLHQVLTGCISNDTSPEDPPVNVCSDSSENFIPGIDDGNGNTMTFTSDKTSPTPTTTAIGTSDTIPKQSDSQENDDTEMYSAFELYCTKNITLRFNLSDYPYGAPQMTFSQFFVAFTERVGQRTDIRRHYYISNFGGGKAHVAFDTLTLSLYLIQMYEREERLSDEGELEIAHIDPNMLKRILETAWVKINVACDIAKNNNTDYYSLSENIQVDINGFKQSNNKNEALLELRRSNDKKISPVELYRRISRYHDRTPEEVAADNREEFDRIMAEYLKMRDETREIDVELELSEKIQNNLLSTTTKFPSHEEYLGLVNKKEEEISKRFEKALDAEYIEVDYTEEKERADKAYDKYQKLKACLHRNVVGDIIFMIVALVSFLVPYGVLQLSAHDATLASNIFLSLNTVALFGLLFVLAVLIQAATFSYKLSKIKTELRGCYRDCYVKDKYSMSQIRNRYRDDLLYIERSRYEIRQLKYLYEANLVKEANVKRHRDMLKSVNSHLSSLLNSLDVKPIPDPNETVSGEFDLSKPIRARENKVYRVFSIDTIEALFNSKGGDN